MAHDDSNFIPNSILIRNLSNGWDILPPERLAGFSAHSLCHIGGVPCVLVVSTTVKLKQEISFLVLKNSRKYNIAFIIDVETWNERSFK